MDTNTQHEPKVSDSFSTDVTRCGFILKLLRKNIKESTTESQKQFYTEELMKALQWKAELNKKRFQVIERDDI